MFSKLDVWAGGLIDSLFFLDPESAPRFRYPAVVMLIAAGVMLQGLLWLMHAGEVAHLYSFTLNLLVVVMYCFRPTVWLLRHLGQAQS